MSPRHSLLCALLASALAAAPSARAQTQAATLAAELYEKAKTLVANGHYAEACPLLERSLELDPEPGTAMNLALSHEFVGRLASAWFMWLRAAALSAAKGEWRREQEARKRATALEPRVPRLRVDVTPQTHEGTVDIRVDGASIGLEQVGTSMPVNPGVHRVDAHVPACRTWFTHVDVEEGKGASVTIPVLEDLDRAGGRRTLAVALGIGALAAAAAGTVFGFEALAANDRIATTCAPTRNVDCNLEDMHNWSLVQTYATVTDAAFAVSATGVVGAAILWFGAPPSAASPLARLRLEPVVTRSASGFLFSEDW